MYIDEIILENIRGFEKLQFSLQRPDKSYAGWTVFTGDNGSGKSTLLKAIAIALVGPEIALTLQPNFYGWVRSGIDFGTITVYLIPQSSDKFVNPVIKPKTDFPARISLRRKHNNVRAYTEIRDSLKARNSIWSGYSLGWFSCGYGPFRRIFGASPEATNQMSAPITKRFVTMFNEAASLSEVNQWLINLSHQTLEGKSDAEEKLRTIINLLNDDLLPNSARVTRVNSDGVWLEDANGTLLGWNEMSDGYRSVLALLVDIMRHLFEAFDYKTLLSSKNDRLVINASGVVLIDEIDAHLHPEWQIKIGFWLKERFPNIQFLVTTHSPLICQAADENGLFVLPSSASADVPRAISSEEYQKIINSRSDVILRSSLFGLQNTRSDQAVDNRKRIAELNAKKRAGAKLTKAEVTELNHLLQSLENEDD
jgi:predicted ATP-binding protein involved in virulence